MTARPILWTSPCQRAIITKALIGYWLTIDGTTIRISTESIGIAMATEHLNLTAPAT